jgi:hypothetical protein
MLLYNPSGVILLIYVDIIFACEPIEGTRALVDEVVQSDIVSVALRENELQAIFANDELAWYVLSTRKICDL